jgi:hypothetical protein
MRAGDGKVRLIRGQFLLLGVLAACLFTAIPARADDDDDEDSSGWADKIGDSIKNTFSGAGKAVGLGGKPEGPPPAEAPSGCPTIAILDGTAGQRVMAAGASGNAGVRYQFSLGSVGRECTLAGGRVSIKVAAGGRVLLGPAGSAGNFDVPIRVVVFNERQQKPEASKLYRVPASIGAGQAGAAFQFVSDDIVVPISGNASTDYSIKVGLDAAKGGTDTVNVKKTRHHGQKPVASAQQ